MITSKSADGYLVIIVGAVDGDFDVATPVFPIGVQWGPQLGETVKQYGILALTPTELTAILKIIANQKVWYYKSSFGTPVPTKIVTLCKANTYGDNVHPVEREMAEKIEKILKYAWYNNPVVEKALTCHLMAGKS